MDGPANTATRAPSARKGPNGTAVLRPSRWPLRAITKTPTRTPESSATRIAGATARFVTNPDYEHGQLSSLLRGLNAVDRPGVIAALVTLVDVPLVNADTVRAVLDRYHQTHAPIVRPVRGHEHGHPVLIDRSLFDEIRRADPSGGAKLVVRAHASARGDVQVDDDGAFRDIDTVDEYERVVGSRSAERNS